MADVVFRSGLLVDGTGDPGFRADLGIEGGRISAIGEPGTLKGHRVIDAAELVVTPGFINMLSHSDLAVLSDPRHESQLLQGITHEVVGQDGLGYAPVSDDTLPVLREQLAGWCGIPTNLKWQWRTIDDYLTAVDAVSPVNISVLLPHGNVRLLVMGDEGRTASDDEIAEMAEIVAQGMSEGAAGLSTGLTYTPASFADTRELVGLAESVARLGGIFAIHHRNYGARIWDGYEEAISIARESGVRLHLSHALVNFPRNRGLASKLLSIIDEAIEQGVSISLDTYPYTAGGTYLHGMLPGWALVGGSEAFQKRIHSADERSKILYEMEVVGADGHHGIPMDWRDIVLSGVVSERYAKYVGCTIDAIADQLGVAPGKAYLDILSEEGFGATCLVEVGNEENIRTIMQHPMHMASTDGLLVGQRPHPRGWGTFPRYVRRYVRELGILTLEECIRQFTGSAANRLRLENRGILQEGNHADISCFNLEEFEDRATNETPTQLATGMKFVMVNGQLAVEDGERTSATAGRGIRFRP